MQDQIKNTTLNNHKFTKDFHFLGHDAQGAHRCQGGRGRHGALKDQGPQLRAPGAQALQLQPALLLHDPRPTDVLHPLHGPIQAPRGQEDRLRMEMALRNAIMTLTLTLVYNCIYSA